MLVRAPLVEAEQDGPIRIQDLTKVVMARRRPGLAEERLVPLEARGNVADADDRPRASHRNSAVDPQALRTRLGYSVSRDEVSVGRRQNGGRAQHPSVIRRKLA